MNVIHGGIIMGKKVEKEKVATNGRKLVSQKAQLEQIRKRNTVILIIGIVLMAIMLATSVMNGMAKKQQLNVTMALN